MFYAVYVSEEKHSIYYNRSSVATLISPYNDGDWAAHGNGTRSSLRRASKPGGGSARAPPLPCRPHSQSTPQAQPASRTAFQEHLSGKM